MKTTTLHLRPASASAPGPSTFSTNKCRCRCASPRPGLSRPSGGINSHDLAGVFALALMLSCGVALLGALSSLHHLLSGAPLADVAPTLSICVAWVSLSSTLVIGYLRNLEIVGGESARVRKRA